MAWTECKNWDQLHRADWARIVWPHSGLTGKHASMLEKKAVRVKRRVRKDWKVTQARERPRLKYVVRQEPFGEFGEPEWIEVCDVTPSTLKYVDVWTGEGEPEV